MIKSTTLNKIKRFSMLSLIAVGSTLAVDAANYYHNGIKYTYTAGNTTKGLAIAKSDATSGAYAGDIVITSPHVIDGIEYPVVSVAATAFKNNANITSIILPDDCITIPRGCFTGCTGLKKVRLSEKLTVFNGNVFDGCTSIDSIVIPAGVTAIKGMQFQGCSSLKYLEFAESGIELDITTDAWGNTATTDKGGFGPIPLEKVVINRPIKDQQPAVTPFRANATLKTAVLGDSCKTINSYMFENCAAFNEITIPAHIATIGTRAFAGTALTTVEVPNAVSTIASATFLNCKNLASVVLNEGTTTIEAQAFMGSSALSSVTLPQSLTSIGVQAFQNCNLSGDIVLPNAVRTLSSEAFAGNVAITSISFPATLANLGESAFRGCSNIASFSIDAANAAYKVNSSNAIVTIDDTKVMAYPAAATATAYIDATATTIAAHAFYGAKNLTEIKIDNCTNFGDYSLAGTSIAKMNLRNTIGRYVLQNCTSLTEVTLENGKEIPFGVCQGCTALTSFVCNEDPLTVKQEAFAECSSLKTLNLGGLLCILETDAFRGCGVETITTNCAMPASMAAGVFTADNANITVYVPEAYADKYKAADGWSYLNIQPDATLVATGTTISMPKGLYYAGTDGVLHCVDKDGYETTYDVGGVPHTFQLLEFQSRIYGASAGVKFTYDANGNATTGDGKLFYISQIDGNTFQAVVIDNTGSNAYADPMGLYIYGDVLYVNDRNVCVRKVSAYSLALPTTYPSWMENNWMYYYNQGWVYGCIKAGFAITKDVDAAGNEEPLYWVGMRYNGNGIFRFKESNIGNAEAPGSKPDQPAILANINLNLSAFYIDEKNDHFYIYIASATDVNAGLYRVKYSDLLANPDPTKFADLNPVLIDGAPIKLEGAAGSQETGITQLAPSEDGEYLYWCYISPESATGSVVGTPAEAYDESNPLHQTGIKRIKLGEEATTVQMLVPGAKGYGIVPVDYENSSVESIEGSVVEANRLQVIGNAVTVLEDATLNIYNLNGSLVAQVATTGVQSVSLDNLAAGLYVVEAVFADGCKEVVKVIR